jgi:Glycosyl hydrolases family 6
VSRLRRCAPAIALLLLAGSLACASAAMAGAPPPPASRWFVDPAEPAARYPDLALLSSQPRFNWQGRWTQWHGFDRWLATVPPDRVPLIATMRSKPNGALANKTSAAMVPWYRRFVRHLGDRRAIIAFEPDSLGLIDTIRPSAARWRRMWALRRSLRLLSQLPNATVYVEAGASDWEPERRTAWQLRWIRVRRARGFVTDVTHDAWTQDEYRHGLAIARRIPGPGPPFAISTAENGRGPIHRRVADGRVVTIGCNPPKRGLGPVPTLNTGLPGVDAFLWVGRPGYSGGSCNGGPRPVGTWWLDRARMFVHYRTQWRSPPLGTHDGLFPGE